MWRRLEPIPSTRSVSFYYSSAISVLSTPSSSNILERRFNLSEQEASYQASFLLAGSIVLYPLVCISVLTNKIKPNYSRQVGFTIDKLKRPYLIFLLFLTSSLLTLFAYFWLVLPPGTTKTAWPPILCFATGTGYSSCGYRSP